MTLCHHARQPPPRPILLCLETCSKSLAPSSKGRPSMPASSVQRRSASRAPHSAGSSGGAWPGLQGTRGRHRSTQDPLTLRGSWGKHRGSSFGSYTVSTASTCGTPPRPPHPLCTHLSTPCQSPSAHQPPRIVPGNSLRGKWKQIPWARRVPSPSNFGVPWLFLFSVCS